MKIYDFDSFAALPSGTIFCYFEPMICTGLHRKGETLLDEEGRARDFFEAYLVAQCWNGDHPTVDAIECRWGMYDYAQQFAVYEPADIETLRKMLGNHEDTP